MKNFTWKLVFVTLFIFLSNSLFSQALSSKVLSVPIGANIQTITQIYGNMKEITLSQNTGNVRVFVSYIGAGLGHTNASIVFYFYNNKLYKACFEPNTVGPGGGINIFRQIISNYGKFDNVEIEPLKGYTKYTFTFYQNKNLLLTVVMDISVGFLGEYDDGEYDLIISDDISITHSDPTYPSN